MFMGRTTPTALSVPNIFSHSVALDVTLFSTRVRIRCAPVGHEPVWCDEEAVRARLPVVKRAVRAHGGVGDVEPDVQGAVPALRLDLALPSARVLGLAACLRAETRGRCTSRTSALPARYLAVRTR